MTQKKKKKLKSDCSLPGSSVHGIFQAGVLEWGAIAFYELDFIGPIKMPIAMEGGERKKIQKNPQNKSKRKKNKCFS